MSGFAVKPCNKKAKSKVSSTNLYQQIAHENLLKIIQLNLLDESRDADIEMCFNRMHIAVFAEWNYFRPALTQRGTPIVRAASPSPAKDSLIPEVRDTIAKYKND